MSQMNDMCSTLLKQCHNNIESRYTEAPKQTSVPKLLKKKIDFEQRKFGVSPQQTEANAKIIQKLKKKYHRKPKEVTIKKTDLGEDLMTFTQQEYEKLQMIDECQERGIKYHEKWEETLSENDHKLSAVARLKKLAQMDDIVDEIRNTREWTEGFNKENHKIVRGHSQKALGFQKRIPSRLSSSNLLNVKIEDPTDASKNTFRGKSLNKYYFTTLNKNTWGKKQFLFTNTKYDSSAKTQEEISLAQKLQIVRQQAQKTADRICRKKSPFMTDIRKDAIFGCQMLRQAQKFLKPSELKNLQFSMSLAENNKESQGEEGEIRGEKQEEGCQAEEILQKNYHRIKAERKRIIEKMIC